MLDEQGAGTTSHTAGQGMKKPWSPPRVILSEGAGEGTENSPGNGADGFLPSLSAS